MSGAGRAAPTAVLGAQSARETSPDRDRTVHEAPVARAHLPKNNTLRRLRGALPRTPPGLPPWTPSPPRMVPTHARALAGLIEILDERACACFEQQPHDANTLALAARESWANSMVQCGEAMVILQIDRCPALQKQFQCALTSTQASCLEQGGASALRSFELALSQATFARFVVRVKVGVLASTCPPLSSQFETIVSTSASLQANFPTPRRFRKNDVARASGSMIFAGSVARGASRQSAISRAPRRSTGHGRKSRSSRARAAPSELFFMEQRKADIHMTHRSRAHRHPAHPPPHVRRQRLHL